jgi:hypothetical protein
VCLCVCMRVYVCVCVCVCVCANLIVLILNIDNFCFHILCISVHTCNYILLHILYMFAYSHNCIVFHKMTQQCHH